MNSVSTRRSMVVKPSKRSPCTSLLARAILCALVLSAPFATAQESLAPSDQPSLLPSQPPSDMPSLVPSGVATVEPSVGPSGRPSITPSLAPSSRASQAPSESDVPSEVPTGSSAPSIWPSMPPSASMAPSIGPSLEPTTGPTVSPTLGPTAVPTGSPSIGPSASPTEPPLNMVVADVFMVLRTVVSTIRGDTIDFFNAQTTTFFQENLAMLDPPIDIMEAVLDSQRLLPTEEARSRRLQGSSLPERPLETRVMVTGEFFGQPLDFGQLLQSVVNSNSTGLIDLLQQEPVIFFRQVETITALEGPVTTPAPSPSPTSAPTPGDGGDDLSGGAIAGIVVGVLAGVALLGGGAYYMRSKGSGSSAGAPLPVGSVDSTAENVATSRQQSYVASSSRPDSDVELYTASENQSQLGSPSLVGSMTDMGDNMSYAYSLDAGNVEPSQAGSALGAVALGGVAGVGAVAAADMVGATVNADGEEAQVKTNQITREVIAPPGKLGIIIDTTLQGPVVHKVNKNSPLEGILFPGDIITAIDATDTRAMSAAAITALMVQTANQQRRLTVLTEETQ